MRSVSFVRLLAFTAVSAGALAVVPVGATASPSGSSAPHGARDRRHAVPAGVPDAPTSPTSTITVVVPLTAPPGAARVLAEVKAARLSRAQRLSRLAATLPSPAQARAVQAWARAHGFAAVGTTALGVSLRGRADRLAAAFGTSLRTTRLDGKAFATPASAPRVPAVLRGVAQPPVGLDTRPLFRHRTTYAGGDVQMLTRSPQRGSTAGTGTTVATVNLSGWHAGDLTTYRRAAFGSGQTTPPVTSVLVGSRTSSVATVHEDDYGLQGEVALDAEAIAGVAPAAAQRMYFANNSSADYVAVLQKMAYDLLHGVAFQAASTSWGACEASVLPSDLTAMRTAISTINAAGAAFFAASGDDGGYGCGAAAPTTASVDVPAVAEDAVAVGGVSMTGTAPSYATTAWSGSGGGCSQLVASSSARVAPVGSPCAKRAVPDIANLADPDTGFWVYDTVDGWGPVGGTSLAAPASAAGLAAALSSAGIADATTATDLFPTIAYLHPDAFTDVTQGDNGLYKAGTGFDLVTGLGVPQWDEVAGWMKGTGPLPIAGHNEPVLFVNPTDNYTAASFELVPGLNGFLPNGEPATGYAAVYGAGSATCSTPTSGTPPTSVALHPQNLVDGVEQISLLVTTTDPDVPSGCITTDRPVVVDTYAPVAPQPAVTYTGTSKPSYRITWGTASDHAPSSGLAVYVLFVDDVTAGTTPVNGFVTTGHSYPYAGSFAAVAGHAYSVELDAYDEAWNVGWKTAGVRAPYDDRSASLGGSWARASSTADYLGSHIYSARAGSYYALRFTGKTLTAGVVRSRYGGYAKVYVDGYPKTTINLYSSSTLYRQRVPLATFTTSGTHTVVVKVLGTHQSGSYGSYVYLDSLAVG